MTSTDRGLRDESSAVAESIAREAALAEAESSVGNLRFDGEKVGAPLGVERSDEQYETHFFET